MLDWTEEDYYWYWFVNIPGVGDVSRKRLMERFGHPRNVYASGEGGLKGLLTQKQTEYLRGSRNTHDIKSGADRLSEEGIRFIHWESPEYPSGFRRLFDPPLGLYLRGTLPPPDMPLLAMVGSRTATPYGIKAAEDFARAFAGQGIGIISGLAAGIDAAGHRGALAGGGYTLGILGGGIDTVYPRVNFNLYMEMYRHGGVLSEYNMGVPNTPGLFPRRNRLISAVSQGVFVLEAGEKSGSLITVDQALEQGKDVYVLPGRITDPLSAGCNRLIAEGGILVQRPEDVTEILLSDRRYMDTGTETGFHKNEEVRIRNMDDRDPCFPQLPEQGKVYELLDEKDPVSFNEILEKTGYTMGKLQRILLEMELSQWICQPSQNNYLKKIRKSFSCAPL